MGGVSPYADRCECAYPDGLPALNPHSVHATRSEIRAFYRCSRCGRTWFTSWIAAHEEAAQ